MPLARPRGLFCRAAAELAAVALLLLLLLLPASSASSAPSARNASDEIEASSTTTAALARPPLSSSAPPPPLSSPAPPPPPRRRRPRPVVLWHGMGDSCCSPQSMGALAAEIGRELPGTRVLSLDTSFGGGDDVMSGFFGDVSAQVARACRWLRSHPAIRDSEDGEFDAVGFSQGGLFLRALVQRCGNGNNASSSSSPPSAPRARTLVTLGAPHQGVTAFPSCDPPASVEGGPREDAAAAAADDDDDDDAPVDPDPDLGASSSLGVSSPSLFCRAAEALIRRGAFAPGVRDGVVQAQYFKPDADPSPFDFFATAEYERYLRLSPFLPRVNCEEGKGEEQKSLPLPSRCRRSGGSLSLASLQKLVLFRFYEDSVVVPRDSAWFSELRRGKVVPLRETPLFATDGGDPLGLRALDESGRLFLRSAPGNHMHFSVDWFVREVVRPFLGDGDGGEEGKGGGAKGVGGREEAEAA